MQPDNPKLQANAQKYLRMLEELEYAPAPVPAERQLTGQVQAEEPWHCTSCHELMYNRDAQGYPAPGAPMPHFWSTEHNRVCEACYGMALALHIAGEYWKTLHEADKEARAKRKDQNDRLTGRRDYFTGA